MSSRLATTCPFCKRPVPPPASLAAQVVICPHCRGEFSSIPSLQTPSLALTPPADPPSPPPTVRSSSAATKTERANGSHAAAPPLPSATPQPPSNTARFKVASSQASTVTPAADGKLPALQLADTVDPAGASSGDKAIPLWLACLAIAASTLISAGLLLYTPGETESLAFTRATARRDLTQYYGSDAAALRPFQVLLREAQQAHSRGDHAQERQRYREVLRLLRAEGRTPYEGLTGTQSSDKKLSNLLATLLAED